MKFFSIDHVFVIIFTALVMTMFSLNTDEIRLIDWVLMYGAILANQTLRNKNADWRT